MNKVVIAIVVVIAVISGIILLGGRNKTTNVVTNQPTIVNEPEAQQSAEAPTFSEHSNTIVLTQSGFEPQTLTVKVGTEVSWVNKSGAVAAINSDPHPIHSNFPSLNLNSFKEGEFLKLVFDKTGTYNYHDHLNPGRTGTVVVE